MKLNKRRSYLGQNVMINTSREMGQMFGRVRLMPAEATLRRRVAHVLGQQRATTNDDVREDGLRLIEIETPRRLFLHRLAA